MTARFDAIGLVVSDMAASVAFYRRLGFAFPEGAEQEPHAEARLPGGLRLLLDTEETVRSFHPGWRPPTGGSRSSLALRCDGPAEVDALYEELVGAGQFPHSRLGDTASGGPLWHAVRHDDNTAAHRTRIPPSQP